MADLPAALAYGKVVGRLILAVADAGDAGRNPDAVAAVGTVSFTPKNPNVKVTTPGGEATVVVQKITCALDADGYLLDPESVQGVWLVTGVYTVTYSLADANLEAHDIDVLDTHTDVAPLDLTTAMPAGVVLTPSQYAELSSRLDAVEAGGGGGGVTDHGALTGLADDDHTQYLTQARGDARYYTETETDTLLANKVANTRTVSAGTGLTGGGDLSTNRTLAVDFATAGVTTAGKVVNASDARLSDARTPLAHNHAGADITSGTVAYARLPIGTTASTVAAGDDSRITGALQATTGQTINAQTGTSYTLVAGDAGKVVTLSNTGAITLNAPGSVFTAGQRVDVIVINTGMATVVGTSGATANGTPSLVSRAQYSAFTIVWLSSTSAVVVGDLA